MWERHSALVDAESHLPNKPVISVELLVNNTNNGRRWRNAVHNFLVLFEYLKSIFASLASNLKCSVYILNRTNIDPMKKKISQANPINRLSPRMPIYPFVGVIHQQTFPIWMRNLVHPNKQMTLVELLVNNTNNGRNANIPLFIKSA